MKTSRCQLPLKCPDGSLVLYPDYGNLITPVGSCLIRNFDPMIKNQTWTLFKVIRYWYIKKCTKFPFLQVIFAYQTTFILKLCFFQRQ